MYLCTKDDKWVRSFDWMQITGSGSACWYYLSREALHRRTSSREWLISYCFVTFLWFECVIERITMLPFAFECFVCGFQYLHCMQLKNKLIFIVPASVRWIDYCLQKQWEKISGRVLKFFDVRGFIYLKRLKKKRRL